MKYIEFREKQAHGTPTFPCAHYIGDIHHPRYVMVPHWHPEFELLRVYRGVFRVTMDGEWFTVGEGDTLWITGGVCHSGYPEEGCEYACLIFDLEKFLMPGLSDYPAVRDILSREYTVAPCLPRDVEGLHEQLERLFAAAREQEPGYELFVQSGLLALLHTVVTKRLYSPGKKLRDSAHRQLQSLKNVVAYIERNYAEHITLEQLAGVAGMSRKYFGSFFQRMTEKTPIEYLNSYRVEQACLQLLYTDKTVAQIAGDCGFGDISYFTKCFRRLMGVTPLVYRKKREAVG